MFNSDSDESSGDSNEGSRICDDMKTVERALKEINAYTKNDLKCMEDCVKYVKDLYDNSKKQRKRSQYNDEFEDLRDENEELKNKMKSTEKKLMKKLEKKDSEIEELTDELEKAKSPKANSDKSHLKDLKESNSELQNDLKEKDNVIARLESKIKNLSAKANSLADDNETLSEKLEEDKRQMTKEIKRLRNTISDKDNEVENVTVEHGKSLKEKQSAIDTIREKMLDKNNENDILLQRLAQSVVELDDCKKDLNDEKSKSKDLERKLTLNEKKIKQLEAEIGNNRINDFQRKIKEDSWHPDWWNRYKVEKKIIQIQCTLCRRMYDVNKIKGHIDRCQNNYF